MGKFMGAGEITVAKRNATTGFPSGAFTTFGCVDTFDPAFSEERGEDHVERCSGLGQVDDPGVVKKRSGTVSMTFTEWNIHNIAKMLQAEIIAAGSPAVASPETLPAGLVDGDAWHLGMASGQSHQNITGLTLTDDDSPPAALTLNTHYTLDAVFGTIKFIDIAGKSQPFITNGYGYTQKQGAAIFTASDDEYIIRVNSLNARQSLAKGIVEFYRARFSIVGSLPLITDDRATFTLTADLIADQTREIDATWGQFGRVIPLA